ncbi:MAG: MBL fold metallo-hydrolase [Clostridiaceae bacterium]|nr:MBL fold metallo-hydrolase [Clostridiaceae bacterium]
MFIPGFRSRNKVKMTIAAIYYLLSLLLALQDIGFSLFAFSIPFIIFSFLDLIKKKNKKSLVILIISVLFFFSSFAASPDENGKTGLNDTTPIVDNTAFPEEKSDVEEEEKTDNIGEEDLHNDKSIKEQDLDNNSDPSIDNQINNPANGISHNQKLEVHFIDVGQADSVLVIQGDSAMLIDAGNNADSSLVTQYIKSKGISRLDYAVGTHPHEDHIGGMDAVINNFDIGKVIMPKVAANTRTFEDVVNAIKNKGLKVTTPIPQTEYKLGDASFAILAPNSDQYDDINDYSVIIKLTFGDNSFIFTGDAEAVSENEVLSKGYNIKADVLKVGHHGSSSSTTSNFLKKVSPLYAVISVGKDNNYGHPHQEVLNLLERENVSVYRTDEKGTIIAISDGSKISFEFDQIFKLAPTPVPTDKTSPTPKPTSVTTPKSSPSAEPTPSPTQPATSGNVIIEKVDLAGELVTIKNSSSKNISLKGWRLVSVEGNQVYYFPDSCIIKGGSKMTIASGKAEGDLKWTNKYIWNNKGDLAELYDSNGKLVSRK